MNQAAISLPRIELRLIRFVIGEITNEPLSLFSGDLDSLLGIKDQELCRQKEQTFVIFKSFCFLMIIIE